MKRETLKRKRLKSLRNKLEFVRRQLMEALQREEELRNAIAEEEAKEDPHKP